MSVVMLPRDTPSGEPVLTVTPPFSHTISLAEEEQVRVYVLPAIKELSSVAIFAHMQRSRGRRERKEEK